MNSADTTIKEFKKMTGKTEGATNVTFYALTRSVSWRFEKRGPRAVAPVWTAVPAAHAPGKSLVAPGDGRAADAGEVVVVFGGRRLGEKRRVPL